MEQKWNAWGFLLNPLGIVKKMGYSQDGSMTKRWFSVKAIIRSKVQGAG
jgi:hypothetical protein